jgi:hypothetical protein
MRNLLKFFIVAATWDAFTTFYGTLSIFVNDYNIGFIEMIVLDYKKTFAALGFSAVMVVKGDGHEFMRFILEMGMIKGKHAKRCAT